MQQKSSPLFIGCAGWSIPREHQERFPGEGSHLLRYASMFSAVEINSSFYQPHRPQTYARWAADTPPGFRFSVKFPRQITHQQRLQDICEPLTAFLDQSSHLGEKLGCYLIQLPPSLKFSQEIVVEFLSIFRQLSGVSAVCEPRHATWFEKTAQEVLSSFNVGYVQADPAPIALKSQNSLAGPVYLRLHGSPRMYYSRYEDRQLQHFREQLVKAQEQNREAWCIFDNTAAGAATINALELQSSLELVAC